MPAIQTTNLTKQYPSTVALDSLDLTVPYGSVYGLLGPNGAGKSTTIDLLMDYIRPTRGQARVLGLDPHTDPTAVHSRVGILPDRFGVYATLTGRQHVEFIMDANGVDDDPDALLARVGLADAAETVARTYSKGMQHRLGLAMALVGAPELLILDEPFAGLDPHGVRLVRELIATETARGATVFLSSHLLDQVERVCDHIGLLADGRLVAAGTPAAVREQAGVTPKLVVTLDAGSFLSQQVTERARAVAGVSTVAFDSQHRLHVACDDPDAQITVLNAVGAVASINSFEVAHGTIEEAFVAMAESAP
ncbi:ABC-type multidrug transport system, ATPase component [Haloferax larsenii JCM 13917]|nr:ABC transporter ATP-binding protein [Haloferax larsenii]ELZ79749.1 ABC-type multidrug transport system, ATPase component [Haloferax larsenii JCM 13917]